MGNVSQEDFQILDPYKGVGSHLEVEGAFPAAIPITTPTVRKSGVGWGKCIGNIHLIFVSARHSAG